MRRWLSVLLAVVAGVAAWCAEPSAQVLREVVSVGRRPLSEIGVQRTTLDSLALRDNVALSMADVLGFNSSVFVKNYGRATLSTVSFRGTSPSHTQVTWNGLDVNSPMLGMTDFSMIPAFLVDKASLLHGTSSVTASGGGLGGAVALATAPAADRRGWEAQYVQGVGSFRTFDEFARVSYGSGRWQANTRVVLSTSANDFRFVNHDKKENVYDDEHNIVAQYHPVERNRSGAFGDLHVLQELYFTPRSDHRLGLSVWLVNSSRHMPLLTTDYAVVDDDFLNRQRERTLRAVASWRHSFGGRWTVDVRGGGVCSRMAYDYRRDGSVVNRSRTDASTAFVKADVNWIPADGWSVAASVKGNYHWVDTRDLTGGYRKSRPEVSASLSARWQPVERLGASVVVRQECVGGRFTPVIPALLVDALVSRAGHVMLRASVSRNHRVPTLNDLYFLPGGNPRLKDEHGFSYDAGVSCVLGPLSVSATWFDSRITDWILWLPTARGFFSPDNVKSVHAYGVELKGEMPLKLPRGWELTLNGSYSWTPSVNCGDALTEADRSVGRQLPYVPRHSASVVGRLEWRRWALTYKWCHYSERFTMSSGDHGVTGRVPAYYMNNVSLEKVLTLSRRVDLSVKLAVNNLFDEDYLSVLSRPMPGINFELFVGVTLR